MQSAARNNFTLLRLAAACTVVAGHGVVLRHSPPEFGFVSVAHEAAAQAVNAFFVMSGFMILQSLDRNPDIYRFTKNRALRIFPGLLVCVVATAFLLGPLVSSYPASQYFSAPELKTFLLRSSTLAGVDFDNLFLPGVFASNPNTPDVNPSLWTLRYELLCYLIFGALAAAGILRQRYRRYFAFAALLLAYVLVSMWLRVSPETNFVAQARRFGFCFLLGAMYASVFPTFRLSTVHVVVGVLFGVASPFVPLHETFRILSVATLVLWVSQLSIDGKYYFADMPDYSYGVYIYSCPIQQAVIGLAPGMGALAQIVVSFAITVPLAALSWHFVENPSLALKSRALPHWIPQLGRKLG